jgi:hypothetical protein
MAKQINLDVSQTADFGAGTDKSTIVNLGKLGILEAISTPAVWNTANVNLRVSLTETGTFLPVYDADGNRVEIVLEPNRFISLNGLVTKGIRYVQLESTSLQNAARSIQVYIRHE